MLSFSAFNRNEWQIFPLLPPTLSYPRTLKTDKEEVFPQGYASFSAISMGFGSAGCCCTLSSHKHAREPRAGDCRSHQLAGGSALVAQGVTTSVLPSHRIYKEECSTLTAVQIAIAIPV